jgi:glutathione synthase/RimK-type ligase-like ATP-grasp enzyme
MILAVGNSSSLEFEAFATVEACIQERGESLVLFKQDKCLEGEYLSYEASGEKDRYLLTIDGRDYDLNEFRGVWYMHPFIAKPLLRFNPPQYRQFISHQFFGMRKAIWELLPYVPWINDPWRVMRAENKILQLHVARKVGLDIPPTLITSDPLRVKNFIRDQKDRVIMKALEPSPMIDEVLFTRMVTPQDLAQIDRIRYAPAIFQGYIPKDHELRVTIVGKETFSVKIYSQDDPETAIDWRVKPLHNDFQVKMERTSLPTEVEEKLQRFMKALELRYGCVDIVVTPEGEYVFLEVNPNGQWYFVQLKSDAEIAPAIASLFFE